MQKIIEQNSKLKCSMKITFNFELLTLNSFRRKGGFTMVELIIYVALVSIFITSAILYSWDVILSREKSYSEQLVGQNARIILAKILYEIKRASALQNLTSDQIALTNSVGTTTISLAGGQITITSGGAGPYRISSDDVRILDQPETPNPLFSNLSDTGNNSKNIRVRATVRLAQTTASASYNAETSIAGSAEVSGQVGAARRLVVNAENVVLANNEEDLRGIVLTNSSSSSITIDSIRVSWVGISAARLTSLQIGGSTVWTGSATSGTTVNIPDYSINSGASVSINYFKFSRNMSETTFTIQFIMTDGSSDPTVVDFTI